MGSSFQMSMITVIVLSACGGIILLLSGGLIIYKCFIRGIHFQRSRPINERDTGNFDSQEVFKRFQEATMEECRKTDQNICSICLFSNDQKNIIVKSPCHHYFHSNCIKNWLNHKNSKPKCPNCNYDLLSQNIVPLPQNYRIEESKLPMQDKNSSSNQTPQKEIYRTSENIENAPKNVNSQNNQITQIELNPQTCCSKESYGLDKSSYKLLNLQKHKEKEASKNETPDT